MKKILLIIALMLFIPLNTNAKEIKLEWQKLWGQEFHDELYKITKLSNGTYIAVGKSNPLDFPPDAPDHHVRYSNSALIINFDKDGNIIWFDNLGNGFSDYFEDAIEVEDGNIIVAGNVSSENIEGITTNGGVDVLLIKYDKNGNIIWKKNWGGSKYDYFSDIVMLSDGSYLVGASYQSKDIPDMPNFAYETSTSADVALLKYDKNGNLLLQKRWGGSKSDGINKIISLKNHEIVFIGNTDSTDIDGLDKKNEESAVLVKYDENFNIIWQKSWEGNNFDVFNDFIELSNGDLVVVGQTESTDIENLQNNGEYDAIIIKYDKDGNKKWERIFGGENTENFTSVKLIDNDNLMVVGFTNSTTIDNLPNRGSEDGLIVKYDTNGNILKVENWGSEGSENFNDIYTEENNGYIIVGTTMSTDIDGLQNPDGITSYGKSDALILKYSYIYNLETKETVNGTSSVLQQNSKGIITPTPEKGFKVEKVIVKDTTGKEIETKLEQDGTYSFDLHDDVTIEVLFALAVDNPKTGIMDFITIIFIGFIISLSGFLLVKNYNERLEI